ncbi:endolytic transglycosylase MltG [Aquabacterium sp. A7-Y]|uniref:endolytic transglycosylase MltG n=1 Tax=Aquabacterium sp. A7-Y TaxID=1349605 RepID=UPI00223CFC81|nr:endolytic transglycosylase MltG [Aquabacterium sp. A7-Y]MCW7540618.1 endolytic transglycosylase MltG [Aquabacterium sp. A7-Y]
MRLLKRLLGVLLLLAVLLTALVGGAALWWLHEPLPLSSPSVEFSVESGMKPRQIAEGWVAAGVQTPALALYEWFRWSGQSRSIRAGSYEIGPGTTPRELLRKMVRGDETLATVKLIEGWTFRQFRAELARAPGLKPTTATLSDAEIMAALGAPERHPEGRFFPDTYAYSKGSSDMAVMQRAYRAMERKLAEAWGARGPRASVKTPDEALILASIVEKETGLSTDRAMVSGVFNNRLRTGMPLQTDPTVIYGLGERFDGNLRKRDLQADTPYNTYLRGGLPPTPIAMPGKASLLAAVQPADTKALYFVARGDGSSVFSDDLPAHNRAVDQFQRKR